MWIAFLTPCLLLSLVSLVSADLNLGNGSRYDDIQRAVYNRANELEPGPSKPICSSLNGCNACRDVSRRISSGVAVGQTTRAVLLDVDLAYQCWQSVPFEPDAALQTIRAVQKFAAFIGNQGFLKNVEFANEKGFEVVDVAMELRKIEAKVLAKDGRETYANEVEFEQDVSDVFLRTRDHHNQFLGNWLTEFMWIRVQDIRLVSVSEDGDVAKVYVYDMLKKQGASAPYVTQINGQDILTWFRSQVSWTTQTYDSNAAFNRYFMSLLHYSNSNPGVYLEPHTYPGSETVLTLSNGTEIRQRNGAATQTYRSWTSITGTNDIYEKFVLKPSQDKVDDAMNDITVRRRKKDRRSVQERSKDPRGSRRPDKRRKLRFDGINNATQSHQHKPRGTQMGSILHPSEGEDFRVAGYLLNIPDRPEQEPVAILELGTLVDDDGSMLDFIHEFILKCANAKVSKLIIDVRWNEGGSQPGLCQTVGLLFPKATPKDITRFRLHPAAEFIGHSVPFLQPATDGRRTSFLDYREFDNVDGNSWETWFDFARPTPIFPGVSGVGAEYYSAPSLNPVIDAAIKEAVTDLPPDGIFAPADVTILSDGICSSACGALINWLTDPAVMPGGTSVNVVTVGGAPEPGPMVSTGGTLGAVAILTSQILQLVELVRPFTPAPILQDYMPEKPRIDFAVSSLNVIDAMSDDTDTVPLQFKPIGSHCRLWYRMEHLTDEWTLYRDVYDVIWGPDPDGGSNADVRQRRCVPGSVTQDIRGG